MSFVFSGDSLGDLITSHGSEKQAQDGNSVTLSCNYTGVVYNLLWYRQYQRSKPELLLFMTESGDPVKEDPSAHWLSAKVDKHRKLMELEISPAKTDSAMYYCALLPTVTGNPHAHSD
uniref:Ig-like domain-containing protein n=1 Tax=Cyprinus carpio TaxID=7962 RepID=A0A8C2F1G0_CYPCA